MQIHVPGKSLQFHVGKQLSFEIPLSEVANLSMATKQELAMEFKLDPQMRKGDAMVEMRWLLPKSANAPATADGDQEEETVQDDAQVLFDKIQARMEVDEQDATGESIAELQQLPFVTPRGRYDVDLFTDCLRMHGKSYDYKILYTAIRHVFLLPKPDDVHTYLVLALDPPIRQGQTRYPHLVLQFLKDEDMELTVEPVGNEEEWKERFEGRLKKVYDGPTAEVFSDVLSGLSGVAVTSASTFKR